MIFRNYKKLNKYKEILDRFTDENRMMCFGVVKSFLSERFKWVAHYRFKNRNNTQTNKHRAFVSFYSDVEMNLNEYGNVDELQTNEFIIDNPVKPKLGSNYYELSSRQYRWVGQEYTEFDQIEYIDASDTLEYDLDYDDSLVDIYHGYGDCGIFVATGYKIPLNNTATDFVYTYENPPSDVELKYDNIEIRFNDSPVDVYTNEYFISYINSLTAIAEGELV